MPSSPPPRPSRRPPKRSSGPSSGNTWARNASRTRHGDLGRRIGGPRHSHDSLWRREGGAGGLGDLLCLECQLLRPRERGGGGGGGLPDGGAGVSEKAGG